MRNKSKLKTALSYFGVEDDKYIGVNILIRKGGAINVYLNLGYDENRNPIKSKSILIEPPNALEKMEALVGVLYDELAGIHSDLFDRLSEEDSKPVSGGSGW